MQQKNNCPTPGKDVIGLVQSEILGNLPQFWTLPDFSEITLMFSDRRHLVDERVGATDCLVTSSDLDHVLSTTSLSTFDGAQVQTPPKYVVVFYFRQLS